VSETYRQRAFAVPPDATELIVIRHGASAALEPGETFELVEGHGDPPLAPEGREQALRVAERLHGEPLRALFVTPLQRTHQTMEPLAAATGLQPQVIGDLREVHLGEWEGGEYRRRMHERDPVAMRALMEERWDVIPGAETMESLAARVGAGLDTMLAAIGPGGTGAAVLHGGVIYSLADTLAAHSLATLIYPQEWLATVEQKINFLRPVERDGIVGQGRVIHMGKRMVYSEAEIHNESGELVAKSTATLVRLPTPAPR